MRAGLLLALLACATAQDWSEDFADSAGLSLLGDARLTHAEDGAAVARLVESQEQVGAVFVRQPLPLQRHGAGLSFGVRLRFRLHSPFGSFDPDDGVQGGDGLCLLLLPRPALGLGGGDLGYRGLDGGIALEFDTWRNGEDTDGNHVGIDHRGEVRSFAAAPLPDSLNDGTVWTAWLEYDAATRLLCVFLSAAEERPAEPVLRCFLDVASAVGAERAVVGVAAATGAAVNVSDVYSLAVTSHGAPLPAESLLEGR